MLAFSLKECGMDPGFLVGGTICNWPFNGERGNGDLFVTEVDESDGTHACTHSFIGVIPNVEDDHSWSVGGVEQLNQNFKSYARKAEHLIYMAGPTADQLFADHPDAERLTEKRAVAEFQQFFPESLQHCWGGYQKWNAVLALKALLKLGIPQSEAVEALGRFPGVERRMTLRYESEQIRVIEDYAHHPTELRAALQAIREMNPFRRSVVIFQPHRYARLERYFNEFAAVLKQGADLI